MRLGELNKIERYFLHSISFSLYISTEEFEHYHSGLQATIAIRDVSVHVAPSTTLSQDEQVYEYSHSFQIDEPEGYSELLQHHDCCCEANEDQRLSCYS